ncbi:MAG: folate-binding protein [Burkholderiaceae bacterium]|nr:folate-binding protein [Burkholderiaceae bacterium]
MTSFEYFFTPSTQPSANLADGFICQLDHLGLILAQGEETAQFLHNQLSNDVENLGGHEVRLAAYCTAKGRMLASFAYWKTADQYFLQLDRSIQASVQKRLQMFVLRTKTKLSDASDEYRLLGVGGANAAPILKNWFTELPNASNNKRDGDAGSLLYAGTANGHARYQWILSLAQLDACLPQLEQLSNDQLGQLTVCDAQYWRRLDIEAGIARIVAATQEQFVPQMINFELVGGVNFKKGCYPGQEIVARSQYLGKLKRRMAIATVALDALLPGTEVFHPSDASQPCGMIVNAEANPAGGSICLVELKLADLEEGRVNVGAADGAALRFLPLPYAIHDVTQ